MFAMLTLVLADNLLLMFVGWEGVGLCSWALIGFWYKDIKNAAAGSKAFIVNRVGDFGFSLGVFLLFWALDGKGEGTIVFREIADKAHLLANETFWGMHLPTLVGLLLFVGATGKSAQIPLYVWLPDAMAGPTPVSALIHAATMVTAGVYMISRMNPIFHLAPDALAVVAWVGAATAIFAASIGLAQNDIKKVLAYSTVSQLGYMFLGVGVGAYAAGIFHLMTHAFFKACLFLGSGSVIHAMGGEQDMRKMGGLRHHMPKTYWTFLISTLALCGFPLTAGFFSKDEILWQAYSSPQGHVVLWVIGVCGAALTAFYMTRQVCMVFFGDFRGDEHTKHHLHESPGLMTMPLIILAVGAIASGYIGLPSWLGGSAFAKWLEPVFAERVVEHEAPATAATEHGEPAHAEAAHGEGHGAVAAAHGGEHGEHHHSLALELGLMAFSVGLAALSALYAVAIYGTRKRTNDWIAGGAVQELVENKYYVDEIYDATIVAGTLGLAKTGAAFDKHVIDGVVDGAASFTRIWSAVVGLFDLHWIDGAVNRLADVTMAWGNRLRNVQTGGINAYLYGIVVAVMVILVVQIW